MKAAWWWIDRWRTSSAYLTMSLEEQGAYRNIIDQLWLSDGLVPEDVMQRAAGATGEEWERVKGKVLSHFIRVPGGYRNETHDRVQSESQARAKRQENLRARAKVGWEGEIASQGGLCSCCGTTFKQPYRKYVVRDHDHVTNQNRGLLCQSCNRLVWAVELGRTLDPSKRPMVLTYLKRFGNVHPQGLNVLTSPSPVSVSGSESPSPVSDPKTQSASEADAPVSTTKKRAPSDPLASELRKRTGCGREQSKAQIQSLRVAGWDDARIQAAIDQHASPGMAPWVWTQRVTAASAPPSMPLTKPNGSLTAAGIIANGKILDANPNLFAAFKKLPPGGTDGSR